MKKIIVAIDGLKYSEAAVDYAVRLVKQNSAHLVGVFLDDFTHHSYKMYDLIAGKGPTEEKKERFDRLDKETRQFATRSFENSCRKAGINYSIHHDRNIAIQELLHESIYADLLIISAGETLTQYAENLPTQFIRELLNDVQCPVLVVPQEYKPVSKVVILYDGEPSSVFAARMFSYVFPALKALEVEIVSVKDNKEGNHVPDNYLVKEFMKRHYPDARYTVLKGVPETEIVNYLLEEEKEALVVLGAYRRSRVSRWFRPSMADTLLKELNVPLFIAHNK